MEKKGLLLAVVAAVVFGLFVGGCADDPNKEEEKHVHKWVEGETITLATCEVAGKKEMICECGEKEIKEIPKLTDCNNNVHTPDVSWYDSSKTEFTITMAEQLAGLAELVNNKRIAYTKTTFKLGNDIVLNDTTNWRNWTKGNVPNNIKSWIPIGKSGNILTNFRGTFDGMGYKICGVYIDSEDEEQGLFGISNGTIKNLGVIASSVNGNKYVGGLVGILNNAGKIIDSYVTGDINGDKFVGGLVGAIYSDEGRVTSSYSTGSVSGKEYVGGLVGWKRVVESIIENSYSTGNVSGEASIGGLVGVTNISGLDNVSGVKGNSLRNDDGGNITNCYATGNVKGIYYYVGGLVGDNNCAIENCYATGNVDGKRNVGGLAGNSNSTITNSYSTGSVSGEASIGGLVGRLEHSTITNSYATGNVNGDENVGGLVGNKFGGFNIITDSYYDKETTKQDDEEKGEGKTTAEMKQQETYENWNFVNIWGINGAINGGYPYLRVFQK